MQETFSCVVCAYTAPADYNAACNLKNRADDMQLLKCKDKVEIKALLDQRHALWRESRLVVVQPPAQLVASGIDRPIQRA